MRGSTRYFRFFLLRYSGRLDFPPGRRSGFLLQPERSLARQEITDDFRLGWHAVIERMRSDVDFRDRSAEYPSGDSPPIDDGQVQTLRVDLEIIDGVDSRQIQKRIEANSGNDQFRQDSEVLAANPFAHVYIVER